MVHVNLIWNVTMRLKGSKAGIKGPSSFYLPSQSCVWATVLILESQSPPHWNLTVYVLRQELCSWTSTHQVNGSLTFHRSPQAGVPCLLLYPILWWSDSIMLYWTQYWPYEVPWALPCLLSWTYMHPLSKWPIHVSIPSLRLELVGALYLIHYPAWQWVKSPILPMNSNL